MDEAGTETPAADIFLLNHSIVSSLRKFASDIVHVGCRDCRTWSGSAFLTGSS